MKLHSEKSSFEFPVITPDGHLATNDLPEIVGLLHAQYLAKYAELSEALIRSTKDKNFIVFALCGRSLIEVTAVLHYYHEKMKELSIQCAESEKYEKTEELTQNVDAIVNLLDQHARGGRFDWFSFFTGDRQHFAERPLWERAPWSIKCPHPACSPSEQAKRERLFQATDIFKAMRCFAIT